MSWELNISNWNKLKKYLKYFVIIISSIIFLILSIVKFSLNSSNQSMNIAIAISFIILFFYGIKILIVFSIFWFVYIILEGYYNLYNSDVCEYHSETSFILIILYFIVVFLQIYIISFITLRFNIFNLNIFYISIFLYIILVIISSATKNPINNIATGTTIISSIMTGINYLLYYKNYNKEKNKNNNFNYIINLQTIISNKGNIKKYINNNKK